MTQPTLTTAAPLTAAEVAARLGQHAPTAEQADVVQAGLGPLLVVAGAGSGKTETMAARVVWLVASGLVAPDRVLGLTFTRKAAGELADRVRLRLRQLGASGGLPAAGTGGVVDEVGVATGAEGGEPTVSTYHSYAAAVVGDHGLRLGVEPRSRLLGEAASWQLAQEVVEGWGDELADAGRAPSTVTEALIALSSECAEHLVDASDLDDHLARVLDVVARLRKDDSGGAPARPSVSSAAAKALAALTARRRLVPLLEAYLRRKRELEVLDFGDQVALAARLAATVPEVGAGERARFDVVLLDEYQDTSHAQLELLRHLFGGGHAVTAVGDPHQSIYGWRGASAGNLDRFRTDFPQVDGSPAPVAWLSTSWRNDSAVLDVANTVAEPLRTASPVAVRPLRTRPGAGAGEVSARWSQTVDDENDGLAAELARLWREGDTAAAAGGVRPTMAVLCRKRSQFAGVEQALRAHGLPVEVVGLGGLLERPEVGDVVATLRVLHDPSRGDALVRLLTGPRWRIGPRDLESLGHWARVLQQRQETRAGSDRGAAGDRPDAGDRAGAGDRPDAVVLPDAVDERSIVDALDSLPGPAWVGGHGRGFSVDGYARLTRLARELSRLRRRTVLPLADLVAEVERSLLLDVELAAVPGTSSAAARAQLDAFGDVAASFADSSERPTLGAFLSWLAAAAVRERGLSQAEDVDDTALAPEAGEASRSAVQVLTVHAAKGLEWDVVAVPGLVEGSFPAGTTSQGHDTAGGWLTGIGTLPYALRGDAASLPVWAWRSAAHLTELESSIGEFRRACGAHEESEERRLAYVATTRARSRLLVSGSWWSDGVKARQPSRYLLAVAEQLMCHPRVHVLGLSADELETGPLAETNPRLDQPYRRPWPYDPLGGRRPAVAEAAALVLSVLDGDQTGAGDDEWSDEVDRLLRERDAARSVERDVVLPVHLSASRTVQLADDPQALAEQIRRPMPAQPRPQTRRGTAFHAWLEERFRAETLVDLDELPGASDDAAPDDELPRLRETFLASPWAQRSPVAVEVAVETPVAGTMLRGRIDAVFATAEGGFEVVDWKTGRPPTGRQRAAAAVQLAVYRLAWARLKDVAVERVGAAFFYASTGETVRPVAGMGEAELEALLASVEPD